jgi:hypothetical protein
MFALAIWIVSVAFVGCGGRDSAKPAIDKDELAKWVEQNPQPILTDKDMDF